MKINRRNLLQALGMLSLPTSPSATFDDTKLLGILTRDQIQGEDLAALGRAGPAGQTSAPTRAQHVTEEQPVPPKKPIGPVVRHNPKRMLDGSSTSGDEFVAARAPNFNKIHQTSTSRPQTIQ